LKYICNEISISSSRANAFWLPALPVATTSPRIPQKLCTLQLHNKCCDTLFFANPTCLRLRSHMQVLDLVSLGTKLMPNIMKLRLPFMWPGARIHHHEWHNAQH
jgi:hypothetical protein